MRSRGCMATRHHPVRRARSRPRAPPSTTALHRWRSLPPLAMATPRPRTLLMPCNRMHLLTAQAVWARWTRARVRLGKQAKMTTCQHLPCRPWSTLWSAGWAAMAGSPPQAWVRTRPSPSVQAVPMRRAARWHKRRRSRDRKRAPGQLLLLPWSNKRCVTAWHGAWRGSGAGSVIACGTSAWSLTKLAPVRPGSLFVPC